MREDLRPGRSFLRADFEEALDEVAGEVLHFGAVVVEPGNLVAYDLVVNFVFLPSKRHFSHQHLIRHDPQCPNIRLQRRPLSLQHLRRHIRQRPDKRLKPFPSFLLPRCPEINYLDVKMTGKNYIGQFHVAVCNLFRVEEGGSHCYLSYVGTGGVNIEATS